MNLKCVFLVSKFDASTNSNLYRYITEKLKKAIEKGKVGLYKLNAADP